MLPKKYLIFFMIGIVLAKDIHYSVVSHISSGCSVGVIIDDQIYPLKEQTESTLLYSGKAPIAKSGYKYCVIEKEKVIDQETFIRTPSSDNTLNEFYNRSWNSLNLVQLPTVLDSLPIIEYTKSHLHKDGQIPTIHIIGDSSEFDYLNQHPELEDFKIPTQMTYISPQDIKTIKKMSISISGSGTRSASKLSYKLKIKNDSLFGYSHLKLRAMARDMSYMKETLAYDIVEKIGLPSSKYSYVRLYFNDRPIGLFGLTEVFKDPWGKNEFGDKHNLGALWIADINQGASASVKMDHSASEKLKKFQSYKGIGSDLTYTGENITLYENAYSLKEKPSIGKANYTRIKELTKFIDRQETSTSIWEQYIDVESVLREFALEFVISDLDGYLANGNNYILYDDLVSDRIVMSGQDFDVTMGLFADESITGDYNEFKGFNRRPLSIALMRVPKYKKRFEELVYAMTSKLLNPTIMFPRIDQLSNMIYQDVKWDQSLPRVSQSSITSYVPFDTAVNGTGDKSSLNLKIPNTDISIRHLYLKEWIQLHSQAILDFFNK